MVEAGGFEVLGHWNMLRKYHYDDFVEDKQAVKAIMRACVENGIVPELNASVFRAIGNFDIDIWAIEYYQSIGGKYVTINSDSHRAEDLFAGCAEVAARLPQGLELCYFEGGKLKTEI